MWLDRSEKNAQVLLESWKQARAQVGREEAEGTAGKAHMGKAWNPEGPVVCPEERGGDWER